MTGTRRVADRPTPVTDVGARPTGEDLSGTRLGRYLVGEELASGGMATVYVAKLEGAAGFEKLVALKRIHPHLAKDENMLRMFLDEARLASQVVHPNVCQIFDFGEADGTYFIAMEYLVGETVSSIRRRIARYAPRGPRITTEDERYHAIVTKVMSDVCRGLHAVHELVDEHGRPLSVVHRDIAPQNLFVTYAGNTKVVDFGIARAKYQLHLTQTGEVRGHLGYMAPEQARGREVDRRADLWSAGVVLWECLTGRRLFARSQSADTLRGVLQGPIPSLRDAGVDAPELQRILDRLVVRDPDARYADADAVSRDLLDVVSPAREADVAQWLRELFPTGEAVHEERLRTIVALRVRPRVDGPPRRRTAAIVILSFGVAAIGMAVAYALGASQAASAPAARVPEVPETHVPPPAPQDAPVPIGVPETVPAEPRSSPEPPAAADEESDRPDARRLRGTGRVNVVTPGGWATVYTRGRRIGQTPLQASLPAGTHRLELRPFGRRPGREVRVRVEPGRTRAVSIPVRAGGVD